MSRKDALATGQLTAAKPFAADPAGCTLHDIVGHARGADSGSVYVSPTYGLVQILADDDWQTPEHIGVGSSERQLKDTYGDLAVHVNGTTVAVPGNARAVYRFSVDQAHRLTSLALELKGKQCTN